MARTAIPTSDLVANSSITTPAGTAVDQANGMVVAAPTPTAGQLSRDQDHFKRLFLRVKNTVGSPLNVIVRAGANTYMAIRSGLGDLTVQVPATTGDVILGPFESARFMQPDGSLNVDFQATFAGTITAFRVPSRDV
jgi:hypothetical protein